MAEKQKPEQGQEPTEKESPPFKRDETLNIHQRINLVMSATERLIKSKLIDVAGGYKVITSDQVTAHVQPILIKYGVTIIPTVVEWGVVDPDPQFDDKGKRRPFRTEAIVRVRWQNIDDKNDFFENEWFGFGIDTSDKGPGKATTYAVRYLVLKTLFIPTGDIEVEDENDDSPAGGNGKRYAGGQAKGSKSSIPFAKRKINEKQEVKLRSMVKELNPTTEAVGEWMAETGAIKFVDLTNEGMDHIIFRLTKGEEGKKLAGAK